VALNLRIQGDCFGDYSFLKCETAYVSGRFVVTRRGQLANQILLDLPAFSELPILAMFGQQGLPEAEEITRVGPDIPPKKSGSSRRPNQKKILHCHHAPLFIPKSV
jgi:hypothetical protein